MVLVLDMGIIWAYFGDSGPDLDLFRGFWARFGGSGPGLAGFSIFGPGLGGFWHIWAYGLRPFLGLLAYFWAI